MNYHAYQPTDDAAELWQLKEAFERELGTESAKTATTSRYENKLTAEYRDRYLTWVDRCVEESPHCLTVADTEDGLIGYIFMLPESLAMIWDAAVINEIYVTPDYRGTEVADELINHGLAVARTQDLPIDRCLLDVSHTNPRARRFYERHGFESWSELVVKHLEH